MMDRLPTNDAKAAWKELHFMLDKLKTLVDTIESDIARIELNYPPAERTQEEAILILRLQAVLHGNQPVA